jgi:hypothetical protein
MLFAVDMLSVIDFPVWTSKIFSSGMLLKRLSWMTFPVLLILILVFSCSRFLCSHMFNAPFLLAKIYVNVCWSKIQMFVGCNEHLGLYQNFEAQIP